MLIEIHMLKNYQPTNLNRDDTGDLWDEEDTIAGGVNYGSREE